MRPHTFPVIFALMIAAGCSTVIADRAVVTGTGPDDLLKLRAGPGLGFEIIMGLPDGTVLNRRSCVTEVGQLWCEVVLAETPQVTGYVSADYLSDI